jgi:hypothetical protein
MPCFPKLNFEMSDNNRRHLAAFTEHKRIRERMHVNILIELAEKFS